MLRVRGWGIAKVGVKRRNVVRAADIIVVGVECIVVDVVIGGGGVGGAWFCLQIEVEVEEIHRIDSKQRTRKNQKVSRINRRDVK